MPSSCCPKEAQLCTIQISTTSARKDLGQGKHLKFSKCAMHVQCKETIWKSFMFMFIYDMYNVTNPDPHKSHQNVNTQNVLILLLCADADGDRHLLVVGSLPIWHRKSDELLDRILLNPHFPLLAPHRWMGSFINGTIENPIFFLDLLPPGSGSPFTLITQLILSQVVPNFSVTYALSPTQLFFTCGLKQRNSKKIWPHRRRGKELQKSKIVSA